MAINTAIQGALSFNYSLELSETPLAAFHALRAIIGGFRQAHVLMGRSTFLVKKDSFVDALSMIILPRSSTSTSALCARKRLLPVAVSWTEVSFLPFLPLAPSIRHIICILVPKKFTIFTNKPAGIHFERVKWIRMLDWSEVSQEVV